MKKSNDIIATIDHPFTFKWINHGESLVSITYPCLITIYNDRKDRNQK